VCELSDWFYVAVGGETTTQLGKTYHIGDTGAWTENKTRIVPGNIFPPVIKIGTTVKTEGTHFMLDDDTGIINWAGGSSPNGALTVGQVVTANYKFYYPVRFKEDMYADSMNFYNLWDAQQIELIQVRE
jgi:hypothetical protein